MEKFYGGYINGVDGAAVRAKLVSLGVTDETAINAAINAAIDVAHRVADEAYWVGVDDGRERGFDNGVRWAKNDTYDEYDK